MRRPSPQKDGKKGCMSVLGGYIGISKAFIMFREGCSEVRGKL